LWLHRRFQFQIYTGEILNTLQIETTWEWPATMYVTLSGIWTDSKMKQHLKAPSIAVTFSSISWRILPGMMISPSISSQPTTVAPLSLILKVRCRSWQSHWDRSFHPLVNLYDIRRIIYCYAPVGTIDTILINNSY